MLAAFDVVLAALAGLRGLLRGDGVNKVLLHISGVLPFHIKITLYTAEHQKPTVVYRVLGSTTCP